VNGFDALAFVVIGRNEGERLRVCLRALQPLEALVVYVDSGSTDGSPAAAEALGARTVLLDMSIPFTAARARNAGYAAVKAAQPGVRYVHFVDADSELLPGWIDAARRFLESRPDVAVVCGRLRERFPAASVYNLLCDMEWDTPVGEAKACGGIALVRAEAFEKSGGFRESLIAGEEPELCVRLRAAGWKIYRLDEEMGFHDAAMYRFSQWWKRSMRAGYAFAEGAALHGRPPERHWVRESRRAWLWGAVLPAGALSISMAAWPWGLLAWAVFPLYAARITLRTRGRLPQRMVRAGFLLLGKFPEAIGQMMYLLRRGARKDHGLIEYK